MVDMHNYEEPDLGNKEIVPLKFLPSACGWVVVIGQTVLCFYFFLLLGEE